MPVPSYRVPVKIARGTYANLLANVASLEEGEIVYANDENALYVVEGGVLTRSSTDLGTSSIGDLNDVDTSTATPTDGQVLTWVNANTQWEPADAAGGGGGVVAFDAILKYTFGDADNTGEWQYWVNFGANDLYINPVDNTGIDASDMFKYLDDSNSVTHVWHSSDSGATWTKRGGTFAKGSGVQFYVFTSTAGQAYLSGDQWFTFADPTQPNRISSNSDVDTYTTAPTDGQVLTWVDTNDQWEPADLQGALVRTALGIGEYADDAAAGTGGVASGAIYYNTTSSDYRLKA